MLVPSDTTPSHVETERPLELFATGSGTDRPPQVDPPYRPFTTETRRSRGRPATGRAQPSRLFAGAGAVGALAAGLFALVVLLPDLRLPSGSSGEPVGPRVSPLRPAGAAAELLPPLERRPAAPARRARRTRTRVRKPRPVPRSPAPAPRLQRSPQWRTVPEPRPPLRSTRPPHGRRLSPAPPLPAPEPPNAPPEFL